MDIGELQGNKYQIVGAVAEYVLEQRDSRSRENTMSGRDIFKAAQELYPGQLGDLNEGTFLAYLSKFARETGSRITCPGHKQGYYLSQMASSLGAEHDSSAGNSDFDDQPGAGQAVRRRQREASLYPSLENWLISQGYKVKNVSNGRSMGKWGNPDVAGIAVLEGFDGTSVEITTIEAKPSLDDWEKWIFEAVSHRRFANRAYFAFAHPEETITKIPSEMRYYSELFGVGVLAIVLDNETYQALHNADTLPDLDAEAIEVIEVFSAPFQYVQPKYQLQLCQSLGLNTRGDLYNWGRSS